MSSSFQHHWLDQYATSYHAWKQARDVSGQTCFYRPLGLIESSFDRDSTYNEGRADVSASLNIEIVLRTSNEQFRRRISLAWTVLRLHRVLLMAKAVDRQADYMPETLPAENRFFLLIPPSTAEEALREAGKQLVFLDDFYEEVDMDDFYRHAQNVARVVNPLQALAKLFVLPIERKQGNRAHLRFLLVMGHQITDGLTNYTWLRHFLDLLNTPIHQLEADLKASCDIPLFRSRLPLPQEDLYSPIPGNTARQRWYWAIMRVLRHTRKPQPAAFPNPLHRKQALKVAVSSPPSYSTVLDYSKVPPLNTYTVHAHIPVNATKKLVKLCREARTSIGAGCFVLVAMVHMSLHEDRYPDETLATRKPFIGSFPINPRPFFNHADEPNSLMLTFSDGVVLPFLPSYLDFSKRFKLYVRQTHRQLSQYQKGTRAGVGSKAGRIIATGYVGAIERTWAKVPRNAEAVSLSINPQGTLIVPQNPTLATCGVSSVGRTAWKEGLYDLDAFEKHIHKEKEEDAFMADFRGSMQNVRARDGEFLVGIWGNSDGTTAANVSFDGNAIDEELAQEWKRRMETMLDLVEEWPKL